MHEYCDQFKNITRSMNIAPISIDGVRTKEEIKCTHAYN